LHAQKDQFGANYGSPFRVDYPGREFAASWLMVSSYNSFIAIAQHFYFSVTNHSFFSGRVNLHGKRLRSCRYNKLVVDGVRKFFGLV
jgi:hypothetical protein